MSQAVFKPPEDFEPLPLDWVERSVPALLERAAERHSDRTALRERGRGISYREWKAKANALVHAVLSRCGPGTGPIVILHGHDGAALVSLFAVLKTGRPYLPLSPLFPAERIQRIVRESGAPAVNGDAGEIAVTSRYLASGYWNSPELTARKFAPAARDPRSRTFYTGDSGRFNADGALEHLGRLDRQVKVRGNRVDVSEVERALNQIPGVREAAVTARPARFQPGEKQLAAYLLLREGARLSANDLRSRLADKLPDYMTPAFFVFLDAFPVNANGKVDRRALPDPVRPADSAAPASDTERRLLSIWTRVFGADDFGVEHDFFELGGSSLMAANLFAEIERAFGKLFPANALLRHGTIRQLARLIEETPGEEAWFLAPLRVTGTRPPHVRALATMLEQDLESTNRD